MTSAVTSCREEVIAADLPARWRALTHAHLSADPHHDDFPGEVALDQFAGDR
jgi:hypothetical protein